jgi:hypothetical protein
MSSQTSVQGSEVPRLPGMIVKPIERRVYDDQG